MTAENREKAGEKEREVAKAVEEKVRENELGCIWCGIEKRREPREMLEHRKRLMNTFVEEQAGKIGDKIYHYTSLVAFLGMITNKKKLWLGNASSMNDKNELRDFINNLRNVVIGDNDNPFYEDYERFFAEVTEYLKDHFPYIMSFSRRRDDAAQWERYADSAKGLCLAVNTENLAKVLWSLKLPAHMLDVFYDYDPREHQFVSIIRDVVEKGRLLGFSSKEGLIDNIVATAASYKHMSFQSEDEIRAVIFSYPGNSNYVTYEYELIRDRLKEFAKIDLGDACESVGIAIEDLFDGIIVGPRSEQDIRVLQKYLSENNFKRLAESIEISECPLR